MPARDLPRPLLALVGLLSAAAIGAEYRGCGSASAPEDEIALPQADGSSCIVDDECPSDECAILACVRGECVPDRPRSDADGDGHAPAPCGLDCDDRSASVRPGAAESCDGIDQDCDGSIDEGAIAARTGGSIPDGLVEARVVAFDDRFAVIGRADTLLSAYLVSTDGTAGPIEVELPIGGLSGRGRFAAVANGSVLELAFVREGAPAERAFLVVDGEGLRVDRTEVIGALPALAVAIAAVGGQTWIAYDALDGAGERRRFLWRSEGSETVELEAGALAPAIAHDGSSVVVLDGDRELSFRAPDGVEIARQVLPGTLGVGDPLASGDGEVLVVYRDAFDHLLNVLSSTSSPSPTFAPGMGREATVGVWAIDGAVLFTRLGAFGDNAWVLTPDLGTVVRALNTALIEGVAPSRVSAATSGGTTLILASLEGTSGLIFLGCP